MPKNCRYSCNEVVWYIKDPKNPKPCLICNPLMLDKNTKEKYDSFTEEVKYALKSFEVDAEEFYIAGRFELRPFNLHNNFLYLPLLDAKSLRAYRLAACATMQNKDARLEILDNGELKCPVCNIVLNNDTAECDDCRLIYHNSCFTTKGRELEHRLCNFCFDQAYGEMESLIPSSENNNNINKPKPIAYLSFFPTLINSLPVNLDILSKNSFSYCNPPPPQPPPVHSANMQNLLSENNMKKVKMKSTLQSNDKNSDDDDDDENMILPKVSEKVKRKYYENKYRNINYLGYNNNSRRSINNNSTTNSNANSRSNISAITYDIIVNNISDNISNIICNNILPVNNINNSNLNYSKDRINNNNNSINNTSNIDMNNNSNNNIYNNNNLSNEIFDVISTNIISNNNNNLNNNNNPNYNIDTINNNNNNISIPFITTTYTTNNSNTIINESNNNIITETINIDKESENVNNVDSGDIVESSNERICTITDDDEDEDDDNELLFPKTKIKKLNEIINKIEEKQEMKREEFSKKKKRGRQRKMIEDNEEKNKKMKLNDDNNNDDDEVVVAISDSSNEEEANENNRKNNDDNNQLEISPECDNEENEADSEDNEIEIVNESGKNSCRSYNSLPFRSSPFTRYAKKSKRKQSKNDEKDNKNEDESESESESESENESESRKGNESDSSNSVASITSSSTLSSSNSPSSPSVVKPPKKSSTSTNKNNSKMIIESEYQIHVPEVSYDSLNLQTYEVVWNKYDLNFCLIIKREDLSEKGQKEFDLFPFENKYAIMSYISRFKQRKMIERADCLIRLNMKNIFNTFTNGIIPYDFAIAYCCNHLPIEKRLNFKSRNTTCCICFNNKSPNCEYETPFIICKFHYECIIDNKCTYCRRSNLNKPTSYMKFINPNSIIGINLSDSESSECDEEIKEESSSCEEESDKDDSEKEKNEDNENNDDIIDDEDDINNNNRNMNKFKTYDLCWYCSKYFGCYPCLKISLNDLPKEYEEELLNNSNSNNSNGMKNKSVIMFIYPDKSKYGIVDNKQLFVFDRKFNSKLLCEERDSFILYTIIHCYYIQEKVRNNRVNYVRYFGRRCSKCYKVMNENEEKIQCEKCNLYFHIGCLKMNQNNNNNNYNNNMSYNNNNNMKNNQNTGLVCFRCKSVKFSPLISEESD